jgi:hypothetical protein
MERQISAELDGYYEDLMGGKTTKQEFKDRQKELIRKEAEQARNEAEEQACNEAEQQARKETEEQACKEAEERGAGGSKEGEA